jgi:hypothetical protein
MAEYTTEGIFKSLKSLLGIIENEERRKQIEAYIDSARVPLERSVFDLLSKFADEVDGELSGEYKVNLRYRPGELELNVERPTPGEATAESFSMAEGDVEKITLRIPSELKDLATEAAARSGLSLNSWFVRMLARSVRDVEREPWGDEGRRGRRHERRGHRGAGQRLSGWVGPE